MEYEFTWSQTTAIELLFEPFGLDATDRIAYFASWKDRWTACEVYEADVLLYALEDGQDLVWVKAGVTILPGIDKRTGEYILLTCGALRDSQ